MIRILAIICGSLLLCPSQARATPQPDRLDRLVARIALYPDPVLAQLLAASTYPLEVLEADRWVRLHPRLKGQALVQAAAQQDWDASVQVLATQPDLLHRMAQDLAWVDALGNAVLAGQADLLAAVQRVRKNAGRQRPAVQSAGVSTFDAAFPESRSSVGWGWVCDWETGAIASNLRFLRRYGYATPQAGTLEIVAWAHSPYHRRTAPYSSAAIAAHYRHESVGTASRSAEDVASNEWVGARTLSSQPSNWDSAFATSPSRAFTRASSDRGLYSMGAPHNGAGKR